MSYVTDTIQQMTDLTDEAHLGDEKVNHIKNCIGEAIEKGVLQAGYTASMIALSLVTDSFFHIARGSDNQDLVEETIDWLHSIMEYVDSATCEKRTVDLAEGMFGIYMCSLRLTLLTGEYTIGILEDMFHDGCLLGFDIPGKKETL